MLHLFALVPHPGRLPGESGALELVQVDESVDAVASEVGDGARDADRAAVLQHAGVVDELTRMNEAVLPARFGPSYADADALRSAIRSRREQLVEALERVRGCVEVGLRVFDPAAASEPDAGTSGRDYMVRRLERVRAAERLG